MIASFSIGNIGLEQNSFHLSRINDNRILLSKSLCASESLCLCVKNRGQPHFQYLVHGAAPFPHNSFRSWYSRLVSIHCQKPS